MSKGPSQRLEIKQGQSLVMTTQLQQSIKLLQLSSLELNEFIEEELEQNPLLTRDEASASGENQAGSEEAKPEQQDKSEVDSVELGESAQLREGGDSLMDSDIGEGWAEEAYESRSVSASGKEAGMGGGSLGSDGFADLEGTVSSEKSLRDHLFEQLHVVGDDPVKRFIGAQLIDYLDESGYLRDETDQLAEQLGVEVELVKETIADLQLCDPTGVFARDLKECLKLQLIEMDRFDPLMELFLENMHLLEKGDVRGLMKVCDVDEEDFATMMADVRMTDPKPARQFHHELNTAVEPDVLVRRGKDGAWLVELNHDALPRVLVNQSYYARLDTSARGKEDKKYITEQMSNASWLVKALDQRANTILRVSTELVKQQEKFFLHGIRFLKPLTLKDIALALDIHESTVSRVTTQKFMSTPRGFFELKYFFTSSVANAAGNSDVSSKTVMFYIKELIDAEDPKKILSDDALVKELKDRNVDVARRTVAKYREALNIPSSVVRRKQKAS